MRYHAIPLIAYFPDPSATFGKPVPQKFLDILAKSNQLPGTKIFVAEDFDAAVVKDVNGHELPADIHAVCQRVLTPPYPGGYFFGTIREPEHKPAGLKPFQELSDLIDAMQFRRMPGSVKPTWLPEDGMAWSVSLHVAEIFVRDKVVDMREGLRAADIPSTIMHSLPGMDFENSVIFVSPATMEDAGSVASLGSKPGLGHLKPSDDAPYVFTTAPVPPPPGMVSRQGVKGIYYSLFGMPAVLVHDMPVGQVWICDMHDYRGTEMWPWPSAFNKSAHGRKELLFLKDLISPPARMMPKLPDLPTDELFRIQDLLQDTLWPVASQRTAEQRDCIDEVEAEIASRKTQAGEDIRI